MSENIFQEFSGATAEQWRNQIIKDLKGADYDEKLIWHTDDGIGVQPFYAKENLKGDFNPSFSHVQWQHCVDILVDTSSEANRFALKALEKGATGLHFIIDKPFDPNVLFNNILFEYIFCVVEVKSTDIVIYESIKRYFSEYKAKQAMRELYLAVDPIAFIENKLGGAVIFYETQLDTLISQFNFSLKINVSTYANAGANHIQQLSFALAHLNEYLSNDVIIKSLQKANIIIEMGVGSNYFFEIAQHRAIRKLCQFLLNEYKIEANIVILSKSAEINKSAIDNYTNLLRTTTEAMSAVIGGCNALSLGRYDLHTKEKQEEAIWWALNQSLILEHESYLNQIADVSAGSYYIENITQSFCELAWQNFKEIEADGGWLKYIESGSADQLVQETFSNLLHQFQNKEKIMIGVNKFEQDKGNTIADYVHGINHDDTTKHFNERNIAQSFNQ
jgi:methylmalonyl-CoA mutase